MFRALQHRNYSLFFFGQGTSLIGTWMQRIALAWLVYRLTGSPLLLGSIAFFADLPTFLLAPFAGVLADRWNRRRTFALLQVLSMLQALVLAWLVLTARVEVWHLFALSGLLGLLTAFDVPIRQSFVIELVNDRSHLANALAMNAMLINGSRLIGPTLGGLLIHELGEGLCFLLNGLSYLAILVALQLMNLPPHAGSRPHSAPFLQELRTGFRYAVTCLPIITVLSLLALVSLAGMSYMTLLPIFAAEILHGGPDTLGYLMAASGIGSLCGALLLARRADTKGLMRWIFISATAFGLSLLLFAFNDHLLLALPILFLGGCGMLVQITASNTVLQSVTTDDMRGRIMSFFTMCFMGMAPFGSLLAGVLAQRFGAAATVCAGGLLCLAAVVVIAGLYTRKRKQEAPYV